MLQVNATINPYATYVVRTGILHVSALELNYLLSTTDCATAATNLGMSLLSAPMRRHAINAIRLGIQPVTAVMILSAIHVVFLVIWQEIALNLPCYQRPLLFSSITCSATCANSLDTVVKIASVPIVVVVDTWTFNVPPEGFYDLDAHQYWSLLIKEISTLFLVISKWSNFKVCC